MGVTVGVRAAPLGEATSADVVSGASPGAATVFANFAVHRLLGGDSWGTNYLVGWFQTWHKSTLLGIFGAAAQN